MKIPIPEQSGFADAVIDALSSNLCVIDENGVIVTVNRAWRDFVTDNPPVSANAGIGSNYLRICEAAVGPGSEEARAFAAGIRSVLDGETELFQMEYPCPSPVENRWFLGRVTPLAGLRGAVISHGVITERKLLEFELIRLATTDPLTGLPNRRFFQEAANLEVERVNRFGAFAAVAMLDIDHFKAINDRHGHASGDQALVRVTRSCSALVRKIDVFARIGGEEFALLLPGTDEAGAAAMAEKLREAIAQTRILAGGKLIAVNGSFGVAQVHAGDRDIDDCLSRADRTPYAAKAAGRDRVVRFSNLDA